MAEGQTLINLMRYAQQEGVTMSELAIRSNLKKQATKKRLKSLERNRKRFESLQAIGDDWWNK